MFTGLVEAEGTLVSRTRIASGAKLFVRAPFAPLVLGESIATDGVCLTVDAFGEGGFFATASSETLEKTTLGKKAIGAKLNLERALPLGGRLGGHIVSGHVDGVGEVATSTREGESTRVTFTYPAALARFLAEKGSIAVNGVSLTVNGVEGSTFHVMLVPHTREYTAWTLAAGEKVNLEVDVLARYVARLLEVGRAVGVEGEGAHANASKSRDDALLAKLAGSGFM